MNVGELFKNFLGAPNPAQVTQGPPASVQQNTTVPNPNNQPNPNPNDPPQLGGGNNPNPPAEKKPETPMDKFAEIWQTPENVTDPNKPITFTADPKKLMEASKNLDFKSFVSSELLQKAAAGGEEGMKAMVEAMNAVAQGTYAQSAAATTKIVEKAVQETQKAFMASLPSMIKRGQFGEQLRSENPMFDHPAVAPVIKNLESQLAVKFPNATAAELTKQAQEFFSSLATSFTPPAKPDPKTEQQMDWGKYFTVGEQ